MALVGTIGVSHSWRGILISQHLTQRFQALQANPFHAILLTAPIHSSLDQVALHLAGILHCTGPVSPCGQCSACMGMAAQTWLDHCNVSPPYKVDRVREVLHDSRYGPHQSKFLTILLHEFHLATETVANTLLKPIETPPNGVVFIITAPSLKHVLPTIRSRCLAIECPPSPIVDTNPPPTEWQSAGWVTKMASQMGPLPSIPHIRDICKQSLGDRMELAQTLFQQKIDMGLMIDKWMVEVIESIERFPDSLNQWEPVLTQLFQFRDRVRYNLNTRLCINSLLLSLAPNWCK